MTAVREPFQLGKVESMNWKTWFQNRRVQVISILALMLGSMALYLYFRETHLFGSVWSHSFYLPVILAAYWWGWRGLFVPVAFSLVLFGVDFSLIPAAQILSDLFRSVCLILSGSASAFMSVRLNSMRSRSRELNRVLSSLRRIDQLLVRAKSPDEIAGGVCQTIMGESTREIAIVLFHPDGTPLSTFCSRNILTGTTRQHRYEQTGLPPCLSNSNERYAFRRSGEQCSSCPFEDSHFGKNSMATRIAFRDRTFGMLCISSDSIPELMNDMTDLVCEMADDIGYALHNLEVSNAKREAEQSLKLARIELETRVQERTSELQNTAERLAREIEAKEATERRLHEGEKALQQILQGINVAAFVLNREHRIVYWNALCEDLTGIPAEQMLGTFNQWQPFYNSQRPVLADLVMEDEATSLLQHWYQGDVHRIDIPSLRFELENLFDCFGTRLNRWIFASASPILDDQGNVVGSVQSLIDTTDRKRNEESLKRSEQLFRSYFELPLIGIGILSDQEHWINANEKLCSLLGYAHEELIRLSWCELIVSDTDNDPTFPTIPSDEPLIRTVQMRRKDGHLITAQISADMVLKAKGTIDFVVVLVEDITFMQQAEEELRESEQRFRSLFEEAAESIIIHELDGSILEVNRRVEDTTRFSREELVGKNISELDMGFAQNEYSGRYLQQVTSGLGEMESRYRHRDHGDFPVEICLKTVILQNRQVVLAMARDIAQRKQNETRMNALVIALEEKNRELNDFAHVVSHDLKAPLRAISSLTNWIANDYGTLFDEAGKRQLQLLLDRAKRLHDLIDGILEYSRIGRSMDRMQPVYLTELVNEVTQLLAPPDNIRVFIDNTLPTIVCEKDRMVQVFQNLIGNAIRFMDKPNGEIRVGCRDLRHHWRFYVRDNGCGIDPRYHERVFQIFQTLRPKTDTGSTGIGLTIVKRIVESYGGRIWIESEPKRGSTFIFTIPKHPRPDTREES
jgi:PAS domain S-box-containing protein